LDSDLVKREEKGHESRFEEHAVLVYHNLWKGRHGKKYDERNPYRRENK